VRSANLGRATAPTERSSMLLRCALSSTLSERSRTRTYILLRDVFSTAELAALPRRSKCAASGVAQLRAVVATIISSAILQMPAPRATPTPITNTNTNVAAGRRIKTLYRRPSTAPPSKVTIVSVSNNLSPRMRVAALILRYPRVFCGIDTSLRAGAYRTIALQRIDRTVKRYWHGKLELNYEEFAQELGYRPAALSGIKKPRTASARRPGRWLRCANTRAPTYSLML